MIPDLVFENDRLDEDIEFEWDLLITLWMHHGSQKNSKQKSFKYHVSVKVGIFFFLCLLQRSAAQQRQKY